MKTNLFALLFIFFISCGNDSQSVDEQITEEPPVEVQPRDLVSENDQEIQDYLAANNLEAVKTDSGLYYIILEEGTGESPTATDDVLVAYKGYFLNGEVFDQSAPEGIEFNLQEVIKGWTEGITYFKEGGSGLLLVPSHLAYGPDDYRGIPGGSVLIFEIKLIEVID